MLIETHNENWHMREVHDGGVNNLLRKRPAAMGTTTISVMLATIPTRLMGKRVSKSKRESTGVTTTANAVDSAVITILSGASMGSIRNVA